MAELKLTQGQVAHYDVTQGSGPTPMRGVFQKPAFGDAVISGATAQEKRIDIGKYSAVVQAIRGRFGDDARAAAIALDVIHGGPVPKGMEQHAGWLGGLKLLAAKEVQRDSTALVTLPAGLEQVAAGQTGMSQVFEQGGQARTRTGSKGGDFSNSPVGASAAMRGAREDLGMVVPANAPKSRGTKATRAGVIIADADTVVRLSMEKLKSKKDPPLDEIKAVIDGVIAKIAK
jgi:hypothetical protein